MTWGKIYRSLRHCPSSAWYIKKIGIVVRLRYWWKESVCAIRIYLLSLAGLAMALGGSLGIFLFRLLVLIPGLQGVWIHLHDVAWLAASWMWSMIVDRAREI